MHALEVRAVADTVSGDGKPSAEEAAQASRQPEFVAQFGEDMVLEPTGSEQLSFLTTTPQHRYRCQVEGERMYQVPVPVLSADMMLGDYDGPIDFVSLD